MVQFVQFMKKETEMGFNSMHYNLGVTYGKLGIYILDQCTDPDQKRKEEITQWLEQHRQKSGYKEEGAISSWQEAIPLY